MLQLKNPSKYTLNLDSPLLKSETKSDVKRGSNKSFSLENIGKLDIGSLLAQNLELLKGFALNFQTLSLFFLVFVGQFYPKHFQKAAIFIGMKFLCFNSYFFIINKYIDLFKIIVFVYIHMLFFEFILM
ncbi:hypothetical protein PFLG_02859 [Plasmodium falciparum RAJ116]|uniref:Uncharacterized protein n=1 Tax=Plasmodium falciparum RAJ116 TaxID=580058 RepID=A0A0L0D2C5_PLAFA|nr:hypothetical protein PFLG_02859 [Plasmodium falciparum RAJ116]